MGLVQEVSVSPDDDPEEGISEPEDDDQNEPMAPVSEDPQSPSFTVAEPFDFGADLSAHSVYRDHFEEADARSDQCADGEDEEYRNEMEEARAAREERANMYVVEYLVTYFARGRSRTTWVRGRLIPPPANPSALEKEMDEMVGRLVPLRYWGFSPGHAFITQYRSGSRITKRVGLVVPIPLAAILIGVVISNSS